jgi:hypothetical protein
MRCSAWISSEIAKPDARASCKISVRSATTGFKPISAKTPVVLRSHGNIRLFRNEA